MQCKMRLEQRISLRRNINQENRHQRMVLELEMQATRDSGLGGPNHLGEMEEIEKVEEKEDFDVRIFRMALPVSLSRHWKLPWLRWSSNPSS